MNCLGNMEPALYFYNPCTCAFIVWPFDIFRSSFVLGNLSRIIMKAIEFQTNITPDGKIEVPGSYIKELKRKQTVRVIVLISETKKASSEEQLWTHLTEEQFLAGYSDADAVYDQVS